MKGFTQVSVTTVILAIKERQRRYDEAKVLLNEAKIKFAELKREAFLGSWWWRNHTDVEVAWAYLPTFSTWDEILFPVVSSDELKIIRDYCYGMNSEVAYYLDQLADASESEYLLLDHKGAAFVSKYKKELLDE